MTVCSATARASRRAPRAALAAGLLAALAAALPPAAAAQGIGTTILPGKGENITRAGTRGAAFLSLGVGARPLAMAGAAVPLSGDLSSLYWNVAGLGEVRSVTAFASHEKLYGNSGLTNSFVGVALPLFGGAAAVSFTSFTSGDIERTTEQWPEGGDPAFGSLVRWSASAVGVHYGRQFTDRLLAGATLKAASEGIEFARASYYGGDVGVRFRSGLFGTTLGFSIVNLGTSGRVDGPATRRRIVRPDNPQFPTGRPLDAMLQTERLAMPTAIRIGVQTDVLGAPDAVVSGGGPHRLLVVTEITDAIDTEIMPALAAEYGFQDRVFLRGGVRFLNDSRVDGDKGTTLSGGAGIKLPIGARRVMLDFAYRRVGNLEANSILSFQFAF